MTKQTSILDSILVAERMIVTDDKVDIKTYRSPLNLVYNAVAPAAAFEDSVFEMRLDYNSRQPRGLEVSGVLRPRV